MKNTNLNKRIDLEALTLSLDIENMDYNMYYIYVDGKIAFGIDNDGYATMFDEFLDVNKYEHRELTEDELSEYTANEIYNLIVEEDILPQLRKFIEKNYEHVWVHDDYAIMREKLKSIESTLIKI